MVDLDDAAFIRIGRPVAKAQEQMVSPAAGPGLFRHLQVFRFADGKFDKYRVCRGNRNQCRRTGRGKGADWYIIDIQFSREWRIDDGIIDVILGGIDLGGIGFYDGLLLGRRRFLIGNDLLGNGILAGQCLIAAQVQFLIGQIGSSLCLIGFRLGQSRVIGTAVQTEQGLSGRYFLTALDVFFHNPAGNLRPYGNLIRSRYGAAVFCFDRRILRLYLVRIDGDSTFLRPLLGPAARQ